LPLASRKKNAWRLTIRLGLFFYFIQPLQKSGDDFIFFHAHLLGGNDTVQFLICNFFVPELINAGMVAAYHNIL
jgi:hypothetical protein